MLTAIKHDVNARSYRENGRKKSVTATNASWKFPLEMGGKSSLLLAVISCTKHISSSWTMDCLDGFNSPEREHDTFNLRWIVTPFLLCLHVRKLDTTFHSQFPAWKVANGFRLIIRPTKLIDALWSSDLLIVWTLVLPVASLYFDSIHLLNMCFEFMCHWMRIDCQWP